MTTTNGTDSTVRWEPPGPGSWTWLASHEPGAPTPWFWRYNAVAAEVALERAFRRYGAPVRTLVFAPVNGRVYTRLVPLIGAKRNLPPPPAFAVWLVSRLHPEFRRRNKTAEKVLASRAWRDDVRRWYEEFRSTYLERNLALQDLDLSGLGDAELADHLAEVLEHARAGHELHFELHAADMGPLGDLIAHCEQWGISGNDAMAAMAGASPASAEAATVLSKLSPLVTAPTPPASLDEVRAIGPEAAEQLDAYVRMYGWRMVTSYDVDGRTLVELPEALLAAIRAAGEGRPEPDATAAIAALRDRVPAPDQPTLDDLVAEARRVYGLRDDNGPLTVQWPVGLLRRALLEVGRRLHEHGALAEPGHAVELEPEEAARLLAGAASPTAAEITQRAARRVALARLELPPTLGPPDVPPNTNALPEALGRLTRLVLAAVDNLEADPGHPAMGGTGVGTEPYTGRARVARRPEDVLGDMEPGDVLVAPFTNPAFNTVMAVAGALVVEEGGVLSHAAVMARELNIPAVVGVRGAVSAIPNGASVTVDPAAGTVTLVAV